MYKHWLAVFISKMDNLISNYAGNGHIFHKLFYLFKVTWFEENPSISISLNKQIARGVCSN